MISLVFVCKWASLWYKKEFLKGTYDLIPSLPRDILNRSSPVFLGFFLPHQIFYIQRRQCQYNHTPITQLSIETICPEDLLTQQAGIIISQCQYFHLNVLPNSEFHTVFNLLRLTPTTASWVLPHQNWMVRCPSLHAVEFSTWAWYIQLTV